MQRIAGFIWEEWVLDKLDWKHGVDPQEVEEAFFNPSYKVRRTGEGKYLSMHDPMVAVVCSSCLCGKPSLSR